MSAPIPGFRPGALGLGGDEEALQELRLGLAAGLSAYSCSRWSPASETDFRMDDAEDAIIEEMLPGLVELIDARYAALADPVGPATAR